MQQALDPTTYKDSITLRARNIRFRNVGSPYAFLDEIGIVAIKEYIYKGASILDVAEALNLPVTILRTWISRNGYEGEINEASTLSAEGYLQQGERLLKTARDKFELDKAKAMLQHGQWMASKKDKKAYGNQVDINSGPAAVSYVFNIGEQTVNFDAHAEEKPKEKEQDTLEAEYNVLPVELDLAHLDRVPNHVIGQIYTGVDAEEPDEEEET